MALGICHACKSSLLRRSVRICVIRQWKHTKVSRWKLAHDKCFKEGTTISSFCCCDVEQSAGFSCWQKDNYHCKRCFVTAQLHSKRDAFKKTRWKENASLLSWKVVFERKCMFKKNNITNQLLIPSISLLCLQMAAKMGGDQMPNMNSSSPVLDPSLYGFGGQKRSLDNGGKPSVINTSWQYRGSADCPVFVCIHSQLLLVMLLSCRTWRHLHRNPAT